MIHVHELHKRIHTTDILRGVNLQVSIGEVAVILGPSGGGKSTLLRTINGLETFDRGQIAVDNLRITPVIGAERESTLRQIRRRVGMVFQQFHLFPHLNVLQNVIEAPIHVCKVARAEAIEQARQLLDRVGLSGKLDAMPHQLSGGQQQRVAIARALALRPDAILFDEPTSALDPRMTAEVVEVMTDLAESGQTMIVVTHAMGFARTVAHTIHVMHEGRIAESGAPEQIFETPSQEVTKQVLSPGSSREAR
jgi:ABC-type polar amino acid transport system ATPase subunit